ncbi:hypothetical protein MQE22_08655 [Acidithiobacillus sp. YTS05]|nr:hypothetical protein MQE22_08655 [Acidithiobacillus sp. YTS05]
MKKPAAKLTQRERADRVLPLSTLTIATLEARLYLEQNVPPARPGDLNDPVMVAGFLRDTVVRPALQQLAFLGMSTAHEIVVRNAPWMPENPSIPACPRESRPMFVKPAGLLVGGLLFRYLAALTDQSTNAHRSYLRAAENQTLLLDVDMGGPALQVYLPEPVALAIGHAVATHFVLGKAIA